MIQRIGFYTGLCWAGSFLLAMLSLTQPLWGFAGNLLGILTIWIAGWQIRAWQQEEKMTFGLRQLWHKCLSAHLLAALICTFAQYVYFRYLDNGQMITTLTRMYNNPDFTRLMAQSAPGYKPQQIIDTIQSMTLSQWTMEFMLLNAFIAIVLSLPTLLVARVKENVKK